MDCHKSFMLNNKLVLIFYSRFCDCALGHRMVDGGLCATTDTVDCVPLVFLVTCTLFVSFVRVFAILINNAGTTKYKLHILSPCALCDAFYGCLAPWTQLFCSIKDSTDQYYSHAPWAINHFQFESGPCVWLRNIIYASASCTGQLVTANR